MTESRGPYGANLLGKTYTRSVQLRDDSGDRELEPPAPMDARRLEGLLNERHLPPRYRVEGAEGAGSSSRVFRVFDRELGRHCAVKVFLHAVGADDERFRRFQHEIRVTAGLQHPNLLPTYDCGISEEGFAWLSMALMTGRSLHDLLDQWTGQGRPPAAIASLQARMRIVMEACRGLIHAHENGVVHHDVKPGNILVGAQGEVVLVDWGAATSAEERRAGRTPRIGTPAYMAPEQARGEACDERSDIASLGATLFHCLYARPPLMEADPGRFRADKEKGVYAPPSAAERRRVPRALQLIVARCLRPVPADRYLSLEAVHDDLQRYLADEPVSVHREGLMTRLGRSYRRQPAGWWAAAVGALLAMVLLGALVGQWSRQRSDWIEVYREDFTDGRFDGPWRTIVLPRWLGEEARDLPADDPDVELAVAGGRLVIGTAFDFQGAVNLVYHGLLPRDVRMEWRSTPLQGGSNLNCFVGGPRRDRAYTFHLTAIGERLDVRLSSRIDGTRMHLVAYATVEQALVVGHSHAFRLEQIDDLLQLRLDGRVVLSHRAPDVRLLRGRQHLGLEVAGNRLAIDDIRVSHLPPPILVSPLEVARQAESHGDSERALQHYRELMAVYPDDRLGGDAAYGAIRCLRALGRKEEMLAACRAFTDIHPGHHRLPYVLTEWAAQELEAGAYEAGLQRLEEASAAVAVGHPLLTVIGKLLDEAVHRRFGLDRQQPVPAAELPAFVAGVRAQLLERARRMGVPVDDPTHRSLRRCAELLLKVFAHEHVVEAYPMCIGQQVEALHELGRGEEVLARWPGDPAVERQLLRLRGDHMALLERFGQDLRLLREIYRQQDRFDELLVLFPGDPEIEAERLVASRRYEEVIERYPRQWRPLKTSLQALGRIEEMLAYDWDDMDWQQFHARLRLRRYHEALWLHDQIPQNRHMVLFARGALALREGRHAEGHELIARSMALVYPRRCWRTNFFLLEPMSRFDHGPAAVRSALVERLRGLPPRWAPEWQALVRYALGELDRPAVETATRSGSGWLVPLAAALRHDLAGRRQEAIAAYRQAESDLPDIAQDDLVAWRLGMLAAE